MAKKENVIVVSEGEAQNMIKKVMSEGTLLWIKKRAWGNRKKVAQDILEEKFKDDAKVVRAVSDLIDSEPIRAITKVQEDVKKYALMSSMPWFHDGVYWIRSDRVEEVDQKLREAQDKIKDELVPDLKSQYPKLVMKALEEHPNLYQLEDFPQVEIFNYKFGIEWGWQKVMLPMSENGAASMVSKEVVDRENKKWQEMLKGVGEEFIGATRKALFDLLKHLRDKLKDPSAKFQDATVEKPKAFLKELSETKFPFEDASIKKLLSDARDILDGVFGEDLRKDKEYRGAIAEVMDDVVGTFEDLPTVKLERFSDF